MAFKLLFAYDPFFLPYSPFVSSNFSFTFESIFPTFLSSPKLSLSVSVALLNLFVPSDSLVFFSFFGKVTSSSFGISAILAFSSWFCFSVISTFVLAS